MNPKETNRYRRMRGKTGRRINIFNTIKAVFTNFSSAMNRKKPVSMLSVIKGLRVSLFALCGALAVVTCVMFIIQWNEGETAAQNADRLLSASGIKPSAAASAESGSNTKLNNAQNPDENHNAFSAELKGYSVIARLDIDTLDLHLPVLSEATDKALTASVCYYTGPTPGGEGNLVVTGHNYSGGQHFGTLDKLQIDDTVLVTDKDNSTYSYVVYELEHIQPDNAAALDDTEYSNELTLLTCEENGNGRLLVRCRELDNG